ncbi:prephenate dehydrogenase [Flavobacterium sp. NRK F10]|uniref:prephenate dehydrogenase n=1 Tax=Flavobacterium sp. NRK F10 TaxID=2954931 RepID=UPI002090D964|nr:prephenate dehydrogenase [Flavobacterium sp. NRK F10]MCO6174377.1 prephenate dehydrogenase [Flavobacterium sp. NRK F10]
MKIYVIGIGLIGGSLAKDFKKQLDNVTVFGVDLNEAHLNTALELGVVDQKATLKDVVHADCVIVSVPVDVSAVILEQVLDLVKGDTLVFDVGSTKYTICEKVKNHPNRRNFLAAHPIAGTEFSGPEAALEGLFEGKTNIICEVEKTAFKLQERALDMFKKIGMRIRYMDPVAHDKHIAYVSHLSHISSFMLGKTVIEKEQNERDIFDLAGSGFESTVRLAKSSPAMWTPIFKQNKQFVLESLKEYIDNLSNFKALLEDDSFEKVYDEMQNTNRIKEILNGISIKK